MKTLTFDERAWRLVPVEITAEIARALHLGDINSSVADTWRGVLSAAPQPETVEMPVERIYSDDDLPEDAEERASFDRSVKRLFEGYALRAVVSALTNLSKANPQQGSLAKMLAIYSNEVARHERYKQLLIRKYQERGQEHLSQIAAAVRAENEGCAKLVEEEFCGGDQSTDYEEGWNDCALDRAQAIRARQEGK